MEIRPSLRPCPECKAPLLIQHGKIQGSVVFSGDSLGRCYITPHTPECTTKTEDHPLPLIEWSVGMFKTGEQP